MSIEPISRPPQAVVVALERVMAGVGERLANIEAEQGLLGCVLLGEKAWWRVASLVKAEDFMDPVHGRIWAAIAERKDRCETVDPIVLKAALAGDPELDERPNYLVELAANVVSVLQVEH
jgi:replicative DNA helicase